MHVCATVEIKGSLKHSRPVQEQTVAFESCLCLDQIYPFTPDSNRLLC